MARRQASPVRGSRCDLEKFGVGLDGPDDAADLDASRSDDLPALDLVKEELVTVGRLSQSLERLSTGLRINRGSDDPSGLIVSERLRSEITGVTAAIDNAERAVNALPAGHRHCAVVEQLVCHPDAGRDRGADREQTRVEVRAVAEIREDVLLLGEGRLPDPAHTLAAHLREVV